MSRHAAITIDVDSLHCYSAIHGARGPAVGVGDDPIYTIGVPRFFDLLEELGVPSTLFLIAGDVPGHAERFSRVETTRSEIASHSFSHDYRLSTKPAKEIDEDLSRADDVLMPLNQGKAIVGFRAPGYNVSSALLDAVIRRGYRYDSSLLPSPLYYALRAGAIFGYEKLGRPSKSLRGNARQFAGPLNPYRTGTQRPWRRVEHGPLVELPMACEPTTRAPLIGTTLPVMPKQARELAIKRALAKLEVFVFEMHAIDLLDESDSPELAALAKSQKDLRVPVSRKMETFRDLFQRLKDDCRVATLDEISKHLVTS